jgi:hypothetical protein
VTDERMQMALQEGFKTLDTAPEDVQRSTRRVLERTAHVRQRGRWWPFPDIYLKTRTPTTSDTTQYQPSPIPATNGHTPTVIGRTQPMFSPSKALIAGALVFGIGGVLLIAQPFQQQGSVPGAATEAVPPTWVTGTVSPASSCTGSDIVWEGDVGSRRNAECNPQMWTSSDPRLTGEVARRWNDDIYRTDEGDIWVDMGAAYLRNDDGSWACSSSDLLKGIGTTAGGTTTEEESVTGGTVTFDCVGDGGYAGLSAILVLKAAEGFSEDIVGLIFSGDFPPVPEPPATE